jgi:hypothetical protein
MRLAEQALLHLACMKRWQQYGSVIPSAGSGQALSVAKDLLLQAIHCPTGRFFAAPLLRMHFGCHSARSEESQAAENCYRLLTPSLSFLPG